MTARERRRRLRRKRLKGRARMRRLRACPAFRACEAAIAARRMAEKRQDPEYRFREKMQRIRREEAKAARRR